jgi:hypothetical protein
MTENEEVGSWIRRRSAGRRTMPRLSMRKSESKCMGQRAKRIAHGAKRNKKKTDYREKVNSEVGIIQYRILDCAGLRQADSTT